MFPSAPKRHAPVPAPRRVRPPSAASSPSSTRYLADSSSPSSSHYRSPKEDLGTQLILRQLAAMQETNKKELARIEADGQQERIRMQAEHRATTETLQAAIASLQHKATHVPPVPVSVSSQPAPINNPAIVLPTPGTSSGTSTVEQGPTVRTAVTSTPAASNDTALTLEGQPPVVTLQPNDLANDPTPIKTFRRDDSMGDAAAIILNGAGLAKMIDLDTVGTKSGFSSKFSKPKNKEAKWPNQYVFRYEDDEPLYDSLEIFEFVSGYFSIMEEVTPVIPQNKKLLAHLDYLRQLMDDVGSMDWESVRAVHRQVLMAMELHRIKWDNTTQVKATKALAVSRVRHKAVPRSAAVTQDLSSTEQPCVQYQKATCSATDDHMMDGTLQLHCCQYCYRKFGAQHPHPKRECRKCNHSKARPKNRKQGASGK